MSRDEVIRCLKTLRLTFPNAYRDLSKADAEEMIAVWLRIFANDSYEAVSDAITFLIRNGAKFAPAAGEIRAEIDKVNPKSSWELNRRPYPQSFVDTVHRFLEEEGYGQERLQ